ncbi:hypothetical protein LINGRAHAP2_LOCUS19864 [Linum grandiflorum]
MSRYPEGSFRPLKITRTSAQPNRRLMGLRPELVAKSPTTECN